MHNKLCCGHGVLAAYRCLIGSSSQSKAVTFLGFSGEETWCLCLLICMMALQTGSFSADYVRSSPLGSSKN